MTFSLKEWWGQPHRDILSGLVVAFAMIPEAIAFSGIAGVDPRVGLFGAFVLSVTLAIVALRAWRLRVRDEEIAFADRLQGRQTQNLERDVGDFVLLRADGVYAYQLAVAVDDEFQGISDVVRGADLIASTPRQIYLQRCLGYRTPRYAHVPVALNAAGEKLSKQTRAPALRGDQAGIALTTALGFLGQAVPCGLERAALGEIWTWALANWSFASIPRQPACPFAGLAPRD